MVKVNKTINTENRRYTKVVKDKEHVCIIEFIETEKGFKVSQTSSSNISSSGCIRTFSLDQKEKARTLYNVWSLAKIKNKWTKILK